MRIALLLGAVSCLGWISTTALGAAPAKKTAPQAKPAIAKENLVELALRAEVRGDREAREEFLKQALQAAPDDAAAHWHAGDVWHDDAWLKPSEVAARLVDDRRLIEYRNTRDGYPDTVAGQLDLAHWCARSGLHDQKRAHLTRVLELNPSHVAARQELGFRWVDGVWLSPEEIAASGRRAALAERSLEMWSPKLLKLRDTLERRSPQQREIARERLLEIREPEAIPALEAVFGAYSEPAALAMLKVIAAMSGSDATAALARQAALSPSDAVRVEAADQLRSRPQVEYVPVLLSGIYSPVQSRSELYRFPDGRLLYQHAYYREGMDQHEVQFTETVFWRRPANFAPGRRNAIVAGYSLKELIQTHNYFTRLAAARDQAAVSQNAYNEEMTVRASQALTTATGQVNPANAADWWNWWSDRNEVALSSADKAVDFRYRYELDVPLSTAVQTWLPRQSSCLVAGTLVSTDTGATPIEQLRHGDRVLAQDPVTGELTFKPVLKTTHRDPVETLCIDAGNAGSLTCSGGHMFWVAGKGWVRARVMEPGMILHTLDGPHEVRSVKVCPPAEVFNLIVADFHSYFVADGRWLTHDNTPQSPTDTIVPGLLATR
ncbi:MAG: polymorphic toxin-type HINT domain-containing protein [Planctomycetia bacterium]|nr:polymorphic toxin-type HINT domain-containing protein [Planctomycetia bacterium]